jgi:hypothetical protein
MTEIFTVLSSFEVERFTLKLLLGSNTAHFGNEEGFANITVSGGISPLYLHLEYRINNFRNHRSVLQEHTL